MGPNKTNSAFASIYLSYFICRCQNSVKIIYHQYVQLIIQYSSKWANKFRPYIVHYCQNIVLNKITKFVTLSVKCQPQDPVLLCMTHSDNKCLHIIDSLSSWCSLLIFNCLKIKKALFSGIYDFLVILRWNGEIYIYMCIKADSYKPHSI